MSNTPCPGCELEYAERDMAAKVMSPDYLAEVLSACPKDTAASDSVYKNRLAVCGTCSALRDAMMCSWCGCYVALRAYPSDSYCPCPGKNLWQDISG